MKKPPHPGRTPAQRRALDAIGCGDYSPIMPPRTKQALLEAGLIEKTGTRTRGSGWAPYVFVDEYQMPIPVHMQWCSAVAEEEQEA